MPQAEMKASLAGLLNAGRFGARSVWAAGDDWFPCRDRHELRHGLAKVAAAMDKGTLEGG